MSAFNFDLYNEELNTCLRERTAGVVLLSWDPLSQNALEHPGKVVFDWLGGLFEANKFIAPLRDSRRTEAIPDTYNEVFLMIIPLIEDPGPARDGMCMYYLNAAEPPPSTAKDFRCGGINSMELFHLTHYEAMHVHKALSDIYPWGQGLHRLLRGRLRFSSRAVISSILETSMSDLCHDSMMVGSYIYRDHHTGWSRSGDQLFHLIRDLARTAPREVGEIQLGTHRDGKVMIRVRSKCDVTCETPEYAR